MSTVVRSFAVKTAALFSATGLFAMLTGCGAGVLAGPSDVAGFKISGHVHGGAYPIQSANIRLMETRNNGTWTAASGNYVGTAHQILTTTSDATGYFNFPDTGWTCNGGQFVYIQVDGGHTTSVTNNNVIQLGVIGSCTDHLSSQGAIDHVNLFVSELSTVAAAYALNDFINVATRGNGTTIANITSDAGDNSSAPKCSGTGTSMSCVHAGLAHGFTNAYNLVDSVRYDGSTPTGRARTSVPGNPQSTVPESLINTLGNILQSCVDSGGGTVATYSSYVPGGTGSTYCGDLFYYATPPGSNPSPPTNTLQAMLNIADYPTNNVDQLFKLQPRAVFFSPHLAYDTLAGNSSQLMSYAMSIFYTGTGLPNDAGTSYPIDVALDSNDNAYIAYTGVDAGTPFGAVNELSAGGQGVFAGAHQSSLPNPGSIALDGNSNVWLSNDAASNGNVFELDGLGNISQTLTVPNGYAAGVAIDRNNSIWTVRDSASNQSLYRFDAGNGYASTTLTAAPSIGGSSKRLFVDNNQNILGVTSNTDPNGNTLSNAAAVAWRFPYASSGAGTTVGTATLSASSGFGIVMSNSDVAYMPISQQLDTENLNSNNVITANQDGSYTGASSSPGNPTYTNPLGVSMDGAGTLFWSDFTPTGQIYKFVMSSAPSASAGTLTSFVPCFPLNGQCDSASVANLRAMAIDSSGALWYLSDGATGRIIQTLGAAAPTFPLVSYAQASVIP